MTDRRTGGEIGVRGGRLELAQDDCIEATKNFSRWDSCSEVRHTPCFSICCRSTAAIVVSMLFLPDPLASTPTAIEKTQVQTASKGAA